MGPQRSRRNRVPRGTRANQLGIDWIPNQQVHVGVFALSVGVKTPEAAAIFDWNRLIGNVYGSDSLTDVDGALGFDPSGWTFVSGPG